MKAKNSETRTTNDCECSKTGEPCTCKAGEPCTCKAGEACTCKAGEACTCKAGEACTCAGETDAEAVARMEGKFGKLPPPFGMMARREHALPAFLAYRDGILEQGPLSPRDRALAQIVAAVAMRLPFCMEKLSKGAKKVGITDDEIVQAALIASIQSSNSMLHTAYDGALLK